MRDGSVLFDRISCGVDAVVVDKMFGGNDVVVGVDDDTMVTGSGCCGSWILIGRLEIPFKFVMPSGRDSCFCRIGESCC